MKETSRSISRIQKVAVALLTMAAILLQAFVATAGIEPPKGWEIATQPEGHPFRLLALHENSASIIVLDEDAEDLEVETVDELLELKVQQHETQFGIREKTGLSDTVVGDGKGRTIGFRCDVPDGKGANIDSRIRLVVVKKGNTFHTVMLSSRVGKESMYAGVFREFLKTLNL